MVSLFVCRLLAGKDASNSLLRFCATKAKNYFVGRVLFQVYLSDQ